VWEFGVWVGGIMGNSGFFGKIWAKLVKIHKSNPTEMPFFMIFQEITKVF
jgi:hypothetical protein